MLFHGTSASNAMGIIKGGFKQSVKGAFGPGVYLTSSSMCAAKYSEKKSATDQCKKWCKILPGSLKISCLVNEILQSEKMNVPDLELRRRTADNGHITKYFEVREVSNQTYEKDSRGRRIRSSRSVESDDYNHYVADERFVVPRYFVQFTRVKSSIF